jgi:predicted metalloprotease
MQFEGREESGNVEDRRGGMSKGMIVGGGGAGILLLILGLVFGVDFGQFGGNPIGGGGGGGRPDPSEEKVAHFAKVVFGDTERIWQEQFKLMGKTYKEPTLVLFTDHVNTACGPADSGVGPFYCPADGKVYIDLSFFNVLEKKLGAPGDFARAYVIAHEVGHHVQRLLGYSARVDEARRTDSKAEANRKSVRLELQADFLAGVWAHHAQKKFNFLDKGDIDEATNAAFRIGDDYLQQHSRGKVQKETFTHGTSKQRRRWFMEGFNSGDVKRAKLLFDLKDKDL